MPFTPAQSTVWIDPLNRTGLATDASPGNTATNPVRTFNGGVLPRCSGGKTDELTAPLTLNFMSGSPADDSDPIDFSPVLAKQSFLRINAFLDSHNLVGTSNLATVTPKNRATGQLLTADLSGVPGVAAGQVLVNKTLGKESRCHVLYAIGGGVFALTQPLSIVDNWPEAASPVPVDTYANGDLFELYNEDLLDIVRLEPVVGQFDPFLADEFTVVTNAGILNATALLACAYIGDTVAFLYSQIQKKVVLTRPAYGRNTVFFGCSGVALAGGGMDVRGTGNHPSLVAGAWNRLLGIGVDLDQDVILSNGFCRELGGVLGAVCIDTGGKLEIAEQSALTDMGVGAALWGKGAIDVTGRLALQGATAVASLLNSGGLTINGKTSVFSATSTTPSVVDGATPLTPANVDALVNLYWPGGGAIATS
jgi:hypothetical protein